MHNKLIIKQVTTGFILFTLFFILYYLCGTSIDFKYGDMPGHAKIAMDMAETGDYFKGTFILYLLANLFSFFSTNIYHVIATICFLLAGSTLLRFFLAQKTLNNIIRSDKDENKSYWLSVTWALSLVFVFAIPVPMFFKNGLIYTGTFTPNVWHNSTVIFMMPFAFLLFTESCKQLAEYSFKRNYILTVLIFLNVFIKPSFFFVFVCIYPLMLLSKYRLGKKFWISLIPLILGVIFLAIDYLTIYMAEAGKIIPEEERSSIGICFMCLFRMNNSYLDLLFSIMFSFLFPIVYTILNFKKIKNNSSYWYIIWMLLLAILISLVFVENGPRYLHGNFYWQVIPCAWLYFYMTVKCITKDIKTEGFLLKNKILLSIYSIHVIIGIYYVIRFITQHTYS